MSTQRSARQWGASIILGLRCLLWTIVPLSILHLGARPAAAGAWSVAPVGSFEGHIVIPQVVVDGLGAVHIIADLDGRKEQYFTDADGSFDAAVIPGLYDFGLLLLDASGQVVVTGTLEDEYTPFPPGLAIRRPLGWVTIPVDGVGGLTRGYTAVQLDHAGQLHVAYARGCDESYALDCGCPGDGYGSILSHAVGSPGGAFAVETVAIQCGRWAANDLVMALDGDGGVHVAWMAGWPGNGDPGPRGRKTEVHYAVRQRSGWSESIVGKVGSHSSFFLQELDLAVDSRGRPHLAYFNSRFTRSSQVIYATRAARGWVRRAVGGHTSYPSIAVGPDDIVHMVYDKRGVLQHHYGRGQRWRTEDIANVPLNTATDVFVDGTNQVHVAFHDEAVEAVMYARRTAP